MVGGQAMLKVFAGYQYAGLLTQNESLRAAQQGVSRQCGGERQNGLRHFIDRPQAP